MDLLSTPSLVESPFIIVKIGKYTFGSPSVVTNGNFSSKIIFPNYMNSIEITKVNGQVNTYTME